MFTSLFFSLLPYLPHPFILSGWILEIFGFIAPGAKNSCLDFVSRGVFFSAMRHVRQTHSVLRFCFLISQVPISQNEEKIINYKLMWNNDYLVCLLYLKNIHHCCFFLFPLSQKQLLFFFFFAIHSYLVFLFPVSHPQIDCGHHHILYLINLICLTTLQSYLTSCFPWNLK